MLCFVFLIQHLILSQNSYNESAQKTGYWVGYYDSGELKYEGNFDNGNEVGCFKYYYKSGNLDTELCYDIPGVQSKALIYYSNGRIKALGNYCNQNRCGLWEYFDDKGNVISKENYVNDLLDGDVIYYFNSIMLECFEYKSGQKNGKSVAFYDSGAIKNLSFYVDDKLEGKFSLFDINGFLIESGFYVEGFREGEWVMYKDNKKVSSTFYKKGEEVYGE